MEVLLNFIKLVIKQGSELIPKPSLLNLIQARHGFVDSAVCPSSELQLSGRMFELEIHDE